MMDLLITISPFLELSVKDLHDALRLRTDVFVVEQACAYAEIDGKDISATHVLGKTDGLLVAYARILPPSSGGLPHIGRVVVQADQRGRGYADAIMRASMLEVERRFGSRDCELAAQAHLQRFYGKHGFERVSDEYLWDGIPHVDMRFIGSINAAG